MALGSTTLSNHKPHLCQQRSLSWPLSANLWYWLYCSNSTSSQDAKKPIFVFVLSSFLCSTLEYFSGVWLEKKWGIRWWNYSEHIFNIQGHICLISAIGFGFGGVLLICLVQPIFNKFYHHMTIKMRITLCLTFLLVFIADATYSVATPNTGMYISTFYPCISVTHALQSLSGIILTFILLL